MPWSRAVVRTEEPSKQADSNTMVVVSSIIPLYSPPITPAIATGFLLSAMTKFSWVNVRSTPSKVVMVSPSLARLTRIF